MHVTGGPGRSAWSRGEGPSGDCSAGTRHGSHHGLSPRLPRSPPGGLRGARTDIGLEVVTAAPLPTMQKLQLAVSSSVRADALNATTFVII